MKSKRGTVWINLGLLLLAAALFLTVYNRMASYEAGETSRQVIEKAGLFQEWKRLTVEYQWRPHHDCSGNDIPQ